MIISGVLSVLLALFAVVFPAISSALPEHFGDYFTGFLVFIAQGVSFVNAFIDSAYVFSLLGLILSVDILCKTFQVIKWILQKIPFFGLS